MQVVVVEYGDVRRIREVGGGSRRSSEFEARNGGEPREQYAGDVDLHGRTCSDALLAHFLDRTYMTVRCHQSVRQGHGIRLGDDAMFMVLPYDQFGLAVAKWAVSVGGGRQLLGTIM